MTRLAALCLVITLASAPFGFTSLGGSGLWLMRSVFFACLILFIIFAAATAWHERPRV